VNSWARDAIEVNASPDVLGARNTVLVNGRVAWSIRIRFPTASARV
jgi:hypothetical protein